MSIQPLRLDNRFETYISGEVSIHPSAVLATGVILQANPNSKIIIDAGVCIGMGSILQVDEGILRVETGANLGAGFLMVGEGTIGANACIGSATTVFNCSVAPKQVVPPGSIITNTTQNVLTSVPTGKETKETQYLESPPPNQTTPGENNGTVKEQGSIEIEKQPQSEKQQISSPPHKLSPSPPPPPTSFHPSPLLPHHPSTQIPTNSPQPLQQPPYPEAQVSNSAESETESANIGNHIYGQTSIQKLLGTLFPHRQPLNPSVSDDRSE